LLKYHGIIVADFRRGLGSKQVSICAISTREENS